MTSPGPLLFDIYYHIYNRGINRENIFIEARNYDYFLKLYEKYLAPVTDLFAYCMLRNHFRILVRVKSEEEIIKTLKVSSPDSKQGRPETFAIHSDDSQGKPLGFTTSRKPLGSRYVSNQFSNFFNAYAKTINKAYGRTGSLFQHPFGRVPVTSDRQFWNVIAYIHQNPQKHRFVDDFRDWKFSSYGVILSEANTVIRRAEVLKWFGTRADYLTLHEQWVTDAQSKWFAGDDED